MRSMAEEYQKEEIQNKVKRKLQQESVKLWLPPYTKEDGQKGEYPEEMLQRYTSDLSLTADQVTDSLESLRQHALEKLSAKNKFQNSGIASLKVKLAGNLPAQATENLPGKVLAIEVSLDVLGQALKQQVAAQSGIDVFRLKLICAGRVIEDNLPLKDQNVKNLCQMMCICLTETEAEARRQEEQVSRVARTRQGAELLAAKEDGGDDDNDNYYLQIADQTGKPIDLPKEERKALVLAMTLHEKGRAALKRKEYGEAVLVLLEADKEFQRCRSSILEAVDNYAILCLDIVWCHLCLQNVNELPDAEMRLQKCDENFRKSYGPNLERLALIRGGTGLERALFMRLHLLQAIVAYHQHRAEQARHLLNRAETELRKLQIDEGTMTQMMFMGFTQQEARLGLRVSEGNLQLAISHIMKRKKKKVPTATLR